jgi:dTDP-4-amino-4,6-dideoxygalactose transaminase
MITKSAYNTDNCNLGLKFTANARTAWGNIIGSLCGDKKLTLLLPAYIGRNDKEGSGVFDPVLNYNTDSEFYGIGEQLEVDIASFEEKIESGNIDVALVIHYFGFCRSDMSKIKMICKQHNVVLVEDCAHAFHLGKPEQIIGNYGDFSFYSVHKYLATKSGGVLKQNNQKYDLHKLKSTELMERSVLELYSNSDFNYISTLRRNNFTTYTEHLKSNVNIEIMFELTPHDIPQTFPVRIKKGLREKLYYFLMDNDLPTVALYYRMIEEIDLESFPLSRQISNEILNLPVHQDTTLDDIILLAKKIIEFFEKKHD